MMKFSPATWGALAGALVGVIAAQALSPKAAHALTCVGPTSSWDYTLNSVESSADTPYHSPYWPIQVRLTTEAGSVHIRQLTTPGADERETIDRVEGTLQ